MRKVRIDLPLRAGTEEQGSSIIVVLNSSASHPQIYIMRSFLSKVVDVAELCCSWVDLLFR